MRLLFVTPFVPHPAARHGGGAYVGQLAAAMAPAAELGLVALQHAGDPLPEAHWQWQAMTTQPPRRRGIAGLRTSAQMFWRWRKSPLVAAKHFDVGVRTAIRRALTEFRPDACFVEFAQMAQYLPDLAGTPVVLTDHEAGCPANTRTGLGALGDARDRRLWRRHVLQHYPLAAVVQAVTREDAAVLGRLLGREVRVRHVAVAAAAAPLDVAAAPPRALFLGDYAHAPNPEAARRLVRDVLPRLRSAVPACELWLAGAHAERIADLADTPGVRVLGFQPDLRGLLAQVRLLLAPVWSGGGFRMKTLTALAHGVPVVSNELGARGGPDDGAGGCVRAESAEGLAAAAQHWLLDPTAAARAGRAAHAWIAAHAAPAAVARDQLALAERLRKARGAVTS